ncbi:hypothetical protein ACHAW5_009323, partial [Stephanodiscus triporus]
MPTLKRMRKSGASLDSDSGAAFALASAAAADSAVAAAAARTLPGADDERDAYKADVHVDDSSQSSSASSSSDDYYPDDNVDDCPSEDGGGEGGVAVFPPGVPDTKSSFGGGRRTLRTAAHDRKPPAAGVAKPVATATQEKRKEEKKKTTTGGLKKGSDAAVDVIDLCSISSSSSSGGETANSDNHNIGAGKGDNDKGGSVLVKEEEEDDDAGSDDANDGKIRDRGEKKRYDGEDDDGEDEATDDTTLVGTHRVITLRTARYSIRLVAAFVRDMEAFPPPYGSSFKRDFFIHLWRRLKGQGVGGDAPPRRRRPRGGDRNGCRWRIESRESRDTLSLRDWAYVPPPRRRVGESGSGRRGEEVAGRDYHPSEVSVALCVLEDISTLDEVSDTYARQAHRFATILPILDRAVTDNVDFGEARRRVLGDDASAGTVGGGGRGCAVPGKSGTAADGVVGRPPRLCNRHNFGLDCSLLDDPYDLSDDGEDERGGSSPTDGTSADDGRDDPNEDECAICGDGGVLICCDGCSNAYHSRCLQIRPESLPDPWHCPRCCFKEEESVDTGDSNTNVQSLFDQPTAHAPVVDCEDSAKSNLLEVEPKVNMPLDILDDKFVWNLARIARVSCEGDKCNVTVRYEGWGSKWDVELPYPNRRLARVFTYTRQVRCFVSLLGSSKIEIGDKVNTPGHVDWTDAWPCKVSFRMPHHNRESARDFLRTEDKFFVQPYMAYALPAVQESMVHGGKWVDRSRLLPWKDLDVSNALNITQKICILQEISPSRGNTDGYVPALSSSQSSKSYCVIKDFCDAYQMAQSDWIQGYLPPNALSRGVLLTDEYLFFPNDVGSDPAVGCRYSGSLIPRKRGWGVANQNGQNRDATKVAFAPVPSLPSPIPILEKTHSNHGVRRLEVSKRWAPFLHVAGNDLFLGSYASQSEARRVVQLASAQSRRENCQGTAAGVR